jgi:hypothetical protein
MNILGQRLQKAQETKPNKILLTTNTSPQAQDNNTSPQAQYR